MGNLKLIQLFHLSILTNSSCGFSPVYIIYAIYSVYENYIVHTLCEQIKRIISTLKL